MDGSDEALRRALRYPYAVPESTPSCWSAAARSIRPRPSCRPATREPLLAYGANASPEGLARKLGEDAAPLPARRATLAGFDVVYSAHLSSYGAVPATLSPSPGTEVSVFVLHLTADQRGAIDATEPNYELSRPPHFECRLDDGELLSGVPAYLSRHGRLELDGSPGVARGGAGALAAAEAELPAMSSRPSTLDRLSAARPGPRRGAAQTELKRRSASRARTP